MQGFEDEAKCDCIDEACLTFGKMAQWAVENKWARRVTLDECLDIISKCNEKGQINVGFPGVLLCNCCKHACINLVASKLLKENPVLPNHFYAVSDPELCKACGTCEERCPADCIELDEFSKHDSEKCYGCGACASVCPEKAVTMVRRSEEEIERVDAEMVEAGVALLSKTTMNWDFGS